MTIIKTDTRGQFIPFIENTNNGYYDAGLPSLDILPFLAPVELGLEKPLLALPLKVEAGLQLYAPGVPVIPESVRQPKRPLRCFWIFLRS